MASIRINNDQHAREIALSKKADERLEREKKLMKMLMGICPPHEVTERYADEICAMGFLNNLYVYIADSGKVAITRNISELDEKHIFEGTYEQAQAFLAERLKGKE